MSNPDPKPSGLIQVFVASWFCLLNFVCFEWKLHVDNYCFGKMKVSKFLIWQIRSLDGVRLLWSLLKNPNDNVQVNDFYCHTFLYDRCKLQATHFYAMLL